MTRMRRAAVGVTIAAGGALLQLGSATGFSSHLSLLGAVIRHAAQFARSVSRPRSGKGPVLVDLASLRRTLPVSQRDSLTVTRLEKAVGYSVTPATEDQAMIRKKAADGTVVEAWIKDDGVFVRLDSLRISGSVAYAFVATATTDRRSPKSSATCPSRMRLTARWSGLTWSVTRADDLITC